MNDTDKNKIIELIKAGEKLPKESIYNVYKHQFKNQPAPKTVKDIEPLVAIQSIIQHVLPPRLQKVRYYGIMTTSQQKKIAKVLPNLIKENKVTIRTLFQIIKALLKIPEDQDLICEKCQGIEFSVSEIPTNSKWYQQHIRKKFTTKSKIIQHRTTTCNTSNQTASISGQGSAMDSNKRRTCEYLMN